MKPFPVWLLALGFLGAAAELQPDPGSLRAALPSEPGFSLPHRYDHRQQVWQRSQRVSDALLAPRDGEMSPWCMLLVSPSSVIALFRLKI